MSHELKTWPAYFAAVWEGRKTFEVRRNDRGFEVGDILTLREYLPGDGSYTGRVIEAMVAYILCDDAQGLEDGYVAMSISVFMRRQG